MLRVPFECGYVDGERKVIGRYGGGGGGSLECCVWKTIRQESKAREGRGEFKLTRSGGNEDRERMRQSLTPRHMSVRFTYVSCQRGGTGTFQNEWIMSLARHRREKQ